jgi:hypothetical protein
MVNLSLTTGFQGVIKRTNLICCVLIRMSLALHPTNLPWRKWFDHYRRPRISRSYHWTHDHHFFPAYYVVSCPHFLMMMMMIRMRMRSWPPLLSTSQCPTFSPQVDPPPRYATPVRYATPSRSACRHATPGRVSPQLPMPCGWAGWAPPPPPPQPGWVAVPVAYSCLARGRCGDVGAS